MTGEPPFRIDPTKLYRVWVTIVRDGVATQARFIGHVRFVPDGDGWGVYIDQPGDTEAYFPPGKWDRLQEYDPSKVIPKNGGP